MNVVTLAQTADITNAAVQVSRTFRTIQSYLKSSGNKRLVLEVARRSIEASKAPGRGPNQVKDEAVAMICGVSWVYQRTGRLSEALTTAEDSMEIGLVINWDRNTAFCHKCIGRLKRMEAETARVPQQKTSLLNESARLLNKAIDDFTRLGLEPEVGDCYSLLARTFLAAEDRQAAGLAIKEAEDRLVDSANKDFLDLQIVKGDLVEANSPGTAEIIYTEVLTAETGEEDAQNSEIMARAYLQRGRVRGELGDNERALVDFRAAAGIWDNLQDPAADVAHWEVERTAAWMDKETRLLLAAEPVGIRVRATRIVNDELAARPAGRSRRRKIPQGYLRGIINRAKKQYVLDQPKW